MSQTEFTNEKSSSSSGGGGVDTSGSTTHFNGSVGTSDETIPLVAGNAITSLILENMAPEDQVDKVLYISFDGGTNYKTIRVNRIFTADPKGDLTQIKVKGAVADCPYELIMNRKA
jgi:hypothetical protein